MLTWFSKDVDLYALLDKWRKVGSNFDPDQPIDNSWKIDGYEVPLGRSETVFEQAVDRLFRYDIYPQDVLQAAADFIRERRPPAYGDRIVQRIRVIPGILDAITMNIVSAVWHEPDRRGFTVVTSDRQYEMGEWTISVTRRQKGDAALLIHAISRPSTRLPVFAGNFARRLQKRGHQRAIEHFVQPASEA